MREKREGKVLLIFSISICLLTIYGSLTGYFDYDNNEIHWFIIIGTFFSTIINFVINMKAKKVYYSMASIITVITILILISKNILAIPNKEGNKSNIIINYDKKVIVEDYINSNKNDGVRVISDNMDTGVKSLPVPDTSEIIYLDPL